MPLGDSITWGLGSEPSFSVALDRGNGYRVALQKRLTAAGVKVDFVGSQKSGTPAGAADLDNEGHPGWTIAQIAGRVDGWLNTYKPDAVLLHIGTNDIAKNADVADAPKRLSALIDQISKARPTAEIFVQKIVQAHVEPLKSLVQAYDEAIPAIVAGKGAKVHLVDQSAIGGLLMYDSLHPNDFGYAEMAFNLYQAMRSVYQTGTTAWPTTANPYRATSARLCFRVYQKANGTPTSNGVCRTWTLRKIAGTTTSKWQRPQAVVETYQVTVAGHYENKTVAGKTTKVWIPRHAENRVRTVTTWLSDDPFVTNVKFAV
jgi:lysophospholipase L1-like esterase